MNTRMLGSSLNVSSCNVFRLKERETYETERVPESMMSASNDHMVGISLEGWM